MGQKKKKVTAQVHLLLFLLAVFSIGVASPKNETQSNLSSVSTHSHGHV